MLQRHATILRGITKTTKIIKNNQKTKVVENFDVKATPTPIVESVPEQTETAQVIQDDEPGDEMDDFNPPDTKMDVSMADVSEQPDQEPLPPKEF